MEFLMQMRRRWILAYVLYVACISAELVLAFDTSVVVSAALFTIIGWTLWTTVYVFRAWLVLAMAWIVLAFMAGSVATSVLGGLGAGVALWHAVAIARAYVKDFLRAIEARRPEQTVLLQACSRVATDPQETFVILTASDGFGHLAAARIWFERLRVAHPHASIHCIDVLDFVDGWNKHVFRWWEFLAMYVPELHALAHRFALWDMKSWTRREARYIAAQVAGGIDGNVTQVIACHTMAAAAAIVLKRSVWRGARVTVACTDLFINPHSFDPGVEGYFLPSDLAFPRKKASPEQRRRTKMQLGLSPYKPAVLVGMGGSGMLPPEKTLKIFVIIKFAARSTGCQFVLACGANLKLAGEAERFFQEVSGVHVLRRRESLRDILGCFDGFLGKPGGLTCADIMCTGVPFAVWYAWRGQERWNLRYLLASGLATYVRNFRGPILGWVASLGANT